MDASRPLPWAKHVGVARSKDGGTRLEVRLAGLEFFPTTIEELCCWLEKRLSRGAPPKAWVDLRGILAGDEGIARFASCLQAVGSEVERLWLSHNALTSGVVPHLHVLLSSPYLRELHVTSNQLDDEAAFGLLSIVADGAASRGPGEGPSCVLLNDNAIRDPPTVLERLRRTGVKISLAWDGEKTWQESCEMVHLVLPSFCDQPLAPGGSNQQAEKDDEMRIRPFPAEVPYHNLVEAANSLTEALENVVVAQGGASMIGDGNDPNGDEEDEIEFVEADTEVEQEGIADPDGPRQAEEATAAPWDPYLDGAMIAEEEQEAAVATVDTTQPADLASGRKSLLGADVAHAISRLRRMLSSKHSKPNPDEPTQPAAMMPTQGMDSQEPTEVQPKPEELKSAPVPAVPRSEFFPPPSLGEPSVQSPLSDYPLPAPVISLGQVGLPWSPSQMMWWPLQQNLAPSMMPQQGVDAGMPMAFPAWHPQAPSPSAVFPDTATWQQLAISQQPNEKLQDAVAFSKARAVEPQQHHREFLSCFPPIPPTTPMLPFPQGIGLGTANSAATSPAAFNFHTFPNGGLIPPGGVGVPVPAPPPVGMFMNFPVLPQVTLPTASMSSTTPYSEVPTGSASDQNQSSNAFMTSLGGFSGQGSMSGRGAFAEYEALLLGSSQTASDPEVASRKRPVEDEEGDNSRSANGAAPWQALRRRFRTPEENNGARTDWSSMDL